MLVVTASLFARTLFSLTTRDAGFDRDPVLIARASPVNQPPEQRLAVFERLRDAAAAVPGVVERGDLLHHAGRPRRMEHADRRARRTRRSDAASGCRGSTP